MRIVCFPCFYYLSEVSRLVETGKALRTLGQDVQFFNHDASLHEGREPFCAGFDLVFARLAGPVHDHCVADRSASAVWRPSFLNAERNSSRSIPAPAMKNCR